MFCSTYKGREGLNSIVACYKKMFYIPVPKRTIALQDINKDDISEGSWCYIYHKVMKLTKVCHILFIMNDHS